MTKPAVPSVGEAVGGLRDALNDAQAGVLLAAQVFRVKGHLATADALDVLAEKARAALRSFESARRVPLREQAEAFVGRVAVCNVTPKTSCPACTRWISNVAYLLESLFGSPSTSETAPGEEAAKKSLADFDCGFPDEQELSDRDGGDR